MPLYTYRIVEVQRTSDGDSGWMLLDLGFDTYRRVNYRLHGVDTPEVRGSERPFGEAVHEAVDRWIKTAETVESLKLDKYGRALVVVRNARGESLNDWLLETQMAMPYEGGSKSDVWDIDTLHTARKAAHDYLNAHRER